MRSLPRRALSVLLLAALAGAAGEHPAQADDPAPASAGSTGLSGAVADLAHWVDEHHGQLGAMVIDVGSGKVLAASGEHAALSPASNAKLLTAATALAELGPDYRYTTGFYGRLHDGAIDNLVLRGHGDPSLGTDDLWRMCRALVELGLQRIDGDILVDQSRFDEAFVPPAFDQQPNEWASFRAPVSAVALERNAITVNVVPRAPGEAAKVWVDPPGFVSVAGAVKTTEKGGGQHIRLSIAPDGGRLRATLSGSVAEGLPRLRFERRVDDPRLYPGFVAGYILRSLGVKIHGGVRKGGEGVRTRLVFHRSRSLSALLQRLGKRSDNFYAETILKTIGAERGSAGSSAAGAEVVTAWLKGIGALEPTTRVVNGSGLFDADRVSAATFAHVLRAAYNDPAVAPEYVGQLSIGGADGTLRHRFRAHRRRRDIRAKTGTLAKAIALSGYVLDAHGGSPVAFSFIVDGITQHAAVRSRLDKVVELIASGR